MVKVELAVYARRAQQKTNESVLAGEIGLWHVVWNEVSIRSVGVVLSPCVAEGGSVLPPWLREAWSAFWSGGEARVTLGISEEPTSFARCVYAIVADIPRGSFLTYGAVASLAGVQGGARAVGQVMRRNPWALFVPCHRVVRSAGKGLERLGGYGGPQGAPIKDRLLRFEGAPV